MKKKFVIITILVFFLGIIYTNKTYALESTYKGFDVVGKIEIPTIELSLPVLKKDTSKSLTVSVAVQWPENEPVLNKIGNVAIAGHNFGNGMLFSNLTKLKNEDTVLITDMEDKVVTYKIYEIKEISGDYTSYNTRETNGKREITLITSIENGEKRLIILAKEENTEEKNDIKANEIEEETDEKTENTENDNDVKANENNEKNNNNTNSSEGNEKIDNDINTNNEVLGSEITSNIANETINNNTDSDSDNKTGNNTNTFTLP